MNRRKIYITPEQYQFYLQTGFPYEGYVIGLGYAYIEYQQIPYRRVLNKEQVNKLSQIGFSKICKLQRLDTSDKAILESYGENLLDQVIEERNGKLYVNMGDGTFMEVSKQSEISLNIDNYNHYTISVRDPKLHLGK